MHIRADMPLVGRVQVYLNGEDITDVCREANDVGRWAICLLRNEHGGFYLLPDRSGPAWERRIGQVTFVFADDAARQTAEELQYAVR